MKEYIAAVAFGIAVMGTTGLAQEQSQRESEQAKARRQIAIVNFENALKLAVRTGASDFVRKLERVPGDVAVLVDAMLLSNPDAQGMRIPSIGGVVFNVRVPGVSSNFMWAQSVLAPQMKAGGVQRRPREGVTGGAQAQNVAGQSIESSPPPAVPLDADVFDPEREYRLMVKAALIDAMLLDSGGLDLADDEFLTVGARRDRPANPLDPTDTVRTVTFTVKGRDSNALRQKKVTLEQARKLVVVDED